MRRMWEHFCFQQYLFSLFEEGGNVAQSTKKQKQKHIFVIQSRFRHFVHFERVRMSIALHVERLAIVVRSAWALDSAS